MNNTSDSDAGPQGILVHKGTWKRVSFDFLAAEIAGVDKELFEALWENYEYASDDTKAVRLKWKRIRKALDLIEKDYEALHKLETYHWTDFGSKLFELQMISDTAGDYLYEKKVYYARHYWIGALWPYFRKKNATRLWGWLAKWIQYVEKDEQKLSLEIRKPTARYAINGKQIQQGERLRMWANSIRRKYRVVGELKKNNSLTRQALAAQLNVLGETGRSDLMAISVGIFNTMIWIASGTRDKRSKLNEAKIYLASAHAIWPFFRKICPDCTWELLRTIRRMQKSG